jgi:hypothetical protein
LFFLSGVSYVAAILETMEAVGLDEQTELAVQIHLDDAVRLVMDGLKWRATGTTSARTPSRGRTSTTRWRRRSARCGWWCRTTPLIDVSAVARQAGILYPVALTAAV